MTASAGMLIARASETLLETRRGFVVFKLTALLHSVNWLVLMVCFCCGCKMPSTVPVFTGRRNAVFATLHTYVSLDPLPLHRPSYGFPHAITCLWLTTQLVRERKCVSQGFCCWDDQKQHEEVKGLFYLPACIPSPRKVRVETQGSAQAMEECCLQTCSPWLAQPGSLRRLRITWPEVVPPQWSLPPNQSFVKKMSHRLTCRSLLLNCSSLFSGNSSLCQVDHKLSRIMAMISLEPWSLQRLGASQSGMSLQRTKQILG